MGKKRGKENKGDFLKRINPPITLVPDKEYKWVTMKRNQKVFFAWLKKGTEIKVKYV